MSQGQVEDGAEDRAQPRDRTQPTDASPWRVLRTWIPMVLVPAMGFMRFVPELVPNGPSMMWMTSSFGPFLIGLLVVLWWLTASRARWFERILGVLGLVGAVGIEQMICHPSMRGPLPIVLTIPMAIAAFAIGTMLFGRMLSVRRTVLALGLAALATAYSALVRTSAPSRALTRTRMPSAPSA